MMFFRQNAAKPQQFFRCERAEATHFKPHLVDPLRPISEYVESGPVVNSRVVRLTESVEKSLPDPLPLPVMNFDNNDDEQVVQNQQTVNRDIGAPEPLLLPSLIA